MADKKVVIIITHQHNVIESCMICSPGEITDKDGNVRQ